MSATLTEAAPGVLLLQFHRPDLGPDLRRVIQNALLEANTRSMCRALVIKGAGAPFAIDPLGEMSAQDAQEEFAMLRSLPESRHLTIAAVDGLAAGGGLALAMAADIRIAGPNSQFQFRTPAAGRSERAGHRLAFLSEAVDPARAMEIALSCRVLTAEDAIELGVARPTPQGDDFVAAVCAWAHDLTANAQGDASQLRRALRLAVARPAPGTH